MHGTMRRRLKGRSGRGSLLAAAGLLAALAAPGECSAHGGFTQVAAVSVCGLTCRPILPPLELFHSGRRQVPRAVPTRPAPPGPYYRVDLASSRPPPAFFVPATGALRSFPDPFGVSDPAWLRLEPRIEARLRQALVGLEPLPSPMLTRATVGGRPVAHPQPYLSLYRPLPVTHGETIGDGAREIRLFSDDLNPWADGYNTLAAGSGGLLARDGEVVKLPPELEQLVSRPDFAKRQRRWATPAGIAVAALALVLFGFLPLARRLSQA
jgi:hypothetical protein